MFQFNLVMTVLVAQANPAIDPLAGGGGWVGAGLLGSVLGWLLFIHLPSKDKQIAALIESRDKMVKEVSDNFKTAIDNIFDRLSVQDKERRDDFREYLQKVVDNYEKEISNTSTYLKKDLAELSQVLTTFSRSFPAGHEGAQKGA